MKPWRVVLLVVGSLAAIAGIVLLVTGTLLGLAQATQRDDAGYFTTSGQSFSSDGYAVTSDKIDLGGPGPDEWWADQDVVTVRLRVKGFREDPIFVGIGPESAVEKYLAGAPSDKVVDVDLDPFEAEYQRENPGGASRPARPEAQKFWVAEASGVGTQTITWDLQPGRWTVVVMNAESSRGIGFNLELGGRIDHLAAAGVICALIGVAILAFGAAMIVGGASGAGAGGSAKSGKDEEVTTANAGPSGPSPVALDGEIDPDLSRWKWLVKWILAIPHFIMLSILWVAFAVATLVAFFGILFTGRYPRGIFDFNVGVLRWTWRVSYYAISPLGTDQYPPFTLEPAAYPASLDVIYPERMSRSLVLVKWWLLALPHLVIVAALTGTFDRDGNGGGVSLLFALVFVAAVTLLVKGRYPKGLFDFIMGIHRWAFRVIAYVALMTDCYPAFRLDQGGKEPSAPGTA